MPDLFQKAETWLAKTRKAHAAQDVRYVRGSSSVSLRATIGRTQFQTDDGNGLLVNLEMRDYLIDAADLALDDIPATPTAGDLIVESIDGVDREYRVTPPSSGEPAWRWSDQFRKVYRIHTKFNGDSLASPP